MKTIQFNIELPDDVAKRVKKDAIEMGVNLRSYSLRAFEQFLSKPINSRRVYFEKQDRKIRGRSISA